MTSHRFGRAPHHLVALHGFTQQGGHFSELAGIMGRGLLAPDLPGHGPRPRPVLGVEAAIAAVGGAIAQADEPVCLLGYSLGGRLALHAALAHRVNRLVIISTSPGIADPVERSERMATDEELANRLEQEGVESFMVRWTSLPLFSGLESRGPDWIEWDLALRRQGTVSGLAASLRALGAGALEDLRPRLGELEMPVLVLAGSEDEKYAALAEEMASFLPACTVEIIDGAGHALVGERPDEVARLVEAFSEG